MPDANGNPTPDEVWTDPKYAQQKSFYQSMFNLHLKDLAAAKAQADADKSASVLDPFGFLFGTKKKSA